MSAAQGLKGQHQGAGEEESTDESLSYCQGWVRWGQHPLKPEMGHDVEVTVGGL